jgi:hypothetical protein
MKYRVHCVRIEHQVFLLEVEAASKDEAEEKAEEIFEEGDYDSENYKVVHAEEFINQVDELEDKHHFDCPAFDGFGCRCEELNKEAA